MGQAGDYSADKIKNQVPEMTQSILDVVAKDIKGPHIAQQVKKAAVKEHKGQKSNRLLARGEVGGDLGNGIARGHEAVSVDKLIEFLPLRQLYKEHQDIDRNNETIDDRVGV